MSELVGKAVYVFLVRLAQHWTGQAPHYKAQYGLYLQGPRWLILRELRKWWDGWECVRCGDRRGLQVHHLSYTHKGKGLGVREFLDLRTLCDKCHAWAHGKD